MKKPTRIFGSPAFQLLAFCLSLVLFSWPFLAPETARFESVFFFLLAAWVLIILVLVLLSRFPGSDGEEDDPAGRGTHE
ncbi:MAG: hypothetical protein HQK59_11525 [Deltaproteobacteria bacterium]|nr:hypothetical protein [Deltaproteobacteria bacterium]